MNRKLLPEEIVHAINKQGAVTVGLFRKRRYELGKKGDRIIEFQPVTEITFGLVGNRRIKMKSKRWEKTGRVFHRLSRELIFNNSQSK